MALSEWTASEYTRILSLTLSFLTSRSAAFLATAFGDYLIPSIRKHYA